MQQLYERIRQRYDRVAEVMQGLVSTQRFRQLKEEDRLRCEKENFIISMMRSNKNVHSISKSTYYRYSYEIMRKISPHFTHKLDKVQRADEHKSCEDTFLNDFVGLYKLFFACYEEQFVFKTKLQSLIRPTNHNLVVDMVKYLLDFSRDYFQQILFWQIRASYVQKTELAMLAQHTSNSPKAKDIGAVIVQERTVLVRQSINDLAIQKSPVHRVQDDQRKDKQQWKKEKDFAKAYQIMAVYTFPAIASQPKDITMNMESLKIRINELYRDMKSRNQVAKWMLQKYYEGAVGREEREKDERRYKEERKDKQDQPQDLQQVCVKDKGKDKEDGLDKLLHPFKVSLVVQKNGYSYISVGIAETRSNKCRDKQLQPLKMNPKMSLSNQSYVHRSEYLLTSLKILRISENFLPPVVNPSHSANVGHLIDVRDKKAMNTENSLSRGHLISSNSNSTKDENEERIHRIVESNPNIGDTRFDRFDKFDHTKFQQTKLENKIFEQTKLEQLKFSRKKLCHLKKPFKSQERNFHSGILNNPDPEQRITEWLQKFNKARQLQRKQVMS